MNNGIGEISLCYTVTFERKSKHSAKRLWAAITDAREVGQWMNLPRPRRPASGRRVEHRFPRNERRRAPRHHRACGPGTHTDVRLGLSVVEWTLEDQPHGCNYRFVHAGLADRGVDADEEGLPAGWHDFLDQFDHHLDGAHLTAKDRTANWKRLKPMYRERLDRVLVPRRVKSLSGPRLESAEGAQLGAVMPYAQGRTFFDADSHIMELPDFLTQYADPAFRDRIPQIPCRAGELAKKLDELLARKAHAPERSRRWSRSAAI
jgi:uncharacterized protein YndB with AHSA1/START domain